MATSNDTGHAKRASVAQVYQAVEQQRVKLINVLGVVQCVRIAARESDPPAELEGAVALLEENVQNILEALERPMLERAIAQGETEGEA
jgi:hypothetical protein